MWAKEIGSQKFAESGYYGWVLTTSSKGQRARDVLGLNHHMPGETLIAVHFPGSAVEAESSARPTFIDAAKHRRFMAWPEGADGQADRAWGRTADLRAFDAGADVIDGCPELVADPVEAGALPNGGLVEFEMLGTVAGATGTGDAEDQAFATRLAGDDTIADLKTKLKNIIGPGASN